MTRTDIAAQIYEDLLKTGVTSLVASIVTAAITSGAVRHVKVKKR
jgi:hypothetical protein